MRVRRNESVWRTPSTRRSTISPSCARPPLRPTQAATPIPLEQTRAAVQALAKAGVDAVKTAIIVAPVGPEKGTLSVIAQETRRLGILTITHAVTVEDTLAAVEAGVSDVLNVAVVVKGGKIVVDKR
jgi:hypothetical protein